MIFYYFEEEGEKGPSHLAKYVCSLLNVFCISVRSNEGIFLFFATTMYLTILI